MYLTKAHLHLVYHLESCLYQAGGYFVIIFTNYAYPRTYVCSYTMIKHTYIKQPLLALLLLLGLSYSASAQTTAQQLQKARRC